ncbi:MAG: hypothetical protein JXM71_01910, partial [Spirochaetales bacterium]|nr:hypothetical protein [Spirochaetales bacterium]
YVMPPRTTLGAVVAAGFDAQADIAMGRAALASREASYPFWISRVSSSSAARSEPGGQWATQYQRIPIRVGDGLLYAARNGGADLLVVPPVDEYAGTTVATIAPLEPYGGRRYVVALALAALYALKLALSLLFYGLRYRSTN